MTELIYRKAGLNGPGAGNLDDMQVGDTVYFFDTFSGGQWTQRLAEILPKRMVRLAVMKSGTYTVRPSTKINRDHIVRVERNSEARALRPEDLLEEVVVEMTPEGTMPTETPKTPEEPKAEKKAPKEPKVKGGRDPRLPPADTTITKVHKGTTYEVLVHDDSFVFDGRTYTSLSKIASEIAGTSANGYAFFKLNG